ncbi:MAG: hypothetical protein LAT66_03495, partial [Alkalimonas sp.]|nr:hypothetical protein [Alkalimonas sp.]
MTQAAVELLSRTGWQVRGASWQPESETWLGHSDSRIEWTGSLQGSWLALSGCIQVLDASAELKLCFLTSTGLVQMPVPTSLKGSINEVFCIPAGASQAWLQPLAQSGRFAVVSLQWRRLSRWQYQWRLWRRIALFCWRTPTMQRQQAGIDWRLLCTAPAECYRRIGQLRACAPEMSYQEWQQRFETLTARQVKALQSRLPLLLAKQGLTILILAHDSATAKEWQQSVRSIEQSLGLAKDHFDAITCALIDADGTEALSSQLPLQQWAFAELQVQLKGGVAEHPVLLLPAGTMLAPFALCWWLESYQSSGAHWLYSDHDSLNEDGQRVAPRFKPDWSLELARSSHYTGDTLLVQAGALLQSGWLKSGSLASVQQLVLQLAELTDVKVEHVPAILW